MMEPVQAILTALTPIKPATESEARAYDASIRQHIALLNQKTAEIASAVSSQAKEILESLEPSLHSISYLFVLQTLTESMNSDAQVSFKLLLDSIVEFLLRFDPLQIRYAGQSLRGLLQRIASGMLFSPLAAVELLSAVILRIDPTGSFFTSTHFMLARLAYNSNAVEHALQVIDRDIVFYPNSRNAKESSFLCDPCLPPASYISTQTGLTDHITTAVVLEYNFVRGLMYTSRREWTKAKDAFEQVISHPVRDRGVSKIMVDSYKRWVLVALLGQGKASAAPSYTSATAHSSYKVTGKAYDDVASAFMSIETESLKSRIQDNASLWEEDGTTSLVQELLSSYQKWEIMRLQKVYERAEIAMIREVTMNAETGKTLEDDDAVVALIRQMIQDGMLHGVLEQDQSGTYVTFSRDTLTEEDFASQMAQSHHNIQFISRQYKQLDDELSSSKEYAKYLAYEQRRAGKKCADADADADAGLGFDSQIEDEDLMSDDVIA
ncbi:hypothetical protein E4U41_004177 [Claviceps citrina]|nr:hypothetical protein E4U41_004177 [Claviceps citrina]